MLFVWEVVETCLLLTGKEQQMHYCFGMYSCSLLILSFNLLMCFVGWWTFRARVVTGRFLMLELVIAVRLRVTGAL